MVIRRIHKRKREITVLRNGRLKKVDVHLFPRRGRRTTSNQPSATSNSPSRTASSSTNGPEIVSVPATNGDGNILPDTFYSKRKRDIEEEWQTLLAAFQDAELDKYNEPISCSDCGVQDTLYRCISCTIWKPVCRQCLDQNHLQPHLHRFEIWQAGTYLPFKTTTPIWSTGHTCATSYQKTMSVLDDQGIQVERLFHLCDCEREAITLLRLGFWPSSPKFPRMAFHLPLMALISNIMLECHVSLKSIAEVIKQRNKANQQHCDIYNVINKGTFTQYRHFQSMMDCIAEANNNCAACFKTSTKIFSLDADFQLVRKHSSGTSWTTPRSIGDIFLPQEPVDQFVANYQPGKTQKDGDCNEFQAASAVRSKNKNKKLDETAVFGSVCRHNFPKYFFSLKHGEKIAYPIYLIKKLLEERTEGQKLYIMYDIACILYRHLKKANADGMLREISLSIPIFHCYGHKMACQINYSPRRVEGIGLTDGENIERLWSYLGKFSNITKEMTPENRVDLLSDALKHYGHKTQDKLASTLVKRHNRAAELEKICKTSLNEQMAVEGVTTEQEIQNWIDEEKLESTRTKNDLEDKLSKQEESACKLQEIQHASQQRSCTTTTSHEVKKLRKQIEKLETHLGFKTGSSKHQELLKSAHDKQRREWLLCLQKPVTERIFLLEVIKKYARGQAIAIRLSRQLKNINKKIKKHIDFYNSVALPVSKFPETIDFDDVKSLESSLWELTFTSSHPCEPPMNSRHQELKTNFCLMKRSQEEQLLLKEEMISVMEFHANQHQELDKSENQKIRPLLVRRLLAIEKEMALSNEIFSPFIGPVLCKNKYILTLGHVGATHELSHDDSEDDSGGDSEDDSDSEGDDSEDDVGDENVGDENVGDENVDNDDDDDDDDDLEDEEDSK